MGQDTTEASSSAPPAYPTLPEQTAPPPEKTAVLQSEAPPAATDAQVGEQYRAALFAQCARGEHESRRKFGVVGIIVACALFPIGLICLPFDSYKACARCGERLDKDKPKRFSGFGSRK